MRILLFSIICCCAAAPSAAQSWRWPPSAAYSRLTAYSAAHHDLMSMDANQASLASVKNFSAGLYGERRFFLADLGSYRLAVALPTGSGQFGAQLNYFGSSRYHESQIGLAYARRMGRVDAGVQFNYHSFKAGGYGNAIAINAEAGLILRMTENFRAGLQVYNPMRVRLGKSGERLPLMVSTGFGYDASERFFFGGEIQKTEGSPVNINAGMQYRFEKKLIARAGIMTHVPGFYFGAGFFWNGLRIDATASWHQYLGLTPGLMMVYNPTKD